MNYRPRFLRAINTMAPTPTAVSTTRLGSGVTVVTAAKSGALAAMKATANRSTELLLFTCSSMQFRLKLSPALLARDQYDGSDTDSRQHYHAGLGRNRDTCEERNAGCEENHGEP